MTDKLTISLLQLAEKFPTEDAARKYLEARRWPNGVRCPVCTQGDNITTRKRSGYYRCNPCREDFTVRIGTVMERSHVPLHKWLYAMYFIVTSRKGHSSLQLSKEIGLTQKTAWFLLHRLREACGAELPKLSGTVEVDATIGRRLTYREFDAMTAPVILQRVVGLVVGYKPKPTTKAAKKRQRKKLKKKRT